MTARATTTPADVEKLCKLMVAHNLVELVVGDVHLRRSPELPGRPAPAESPLEQLARMSPDQQERALMLSRLNGAG